MKSDGPYLGRFDDPRELTLPEIVGLQWQPKGVLAAVQVAPLLREHESEVVIRGSVPELQLSDFGSVNLRTGGNVYLRAAAALLRIGHSRGERHVQQFGRTALRFLTAPVVTCGCLDVRVSGQPLHGRHVGTRVQQVADERPAEVVRREGCDARLLGPTLEHQQNGLIGYATVDERAASPVRRPKEGPGSSLEQPATRQAPASRRCGRAVAWPRQRPLLFGLGES